MNRLVQVVVTAASAFYSLAGIGESFSDLEGSAASKEFTPAERRYFTEATNKYQKYTISNDFKARSIISWLDNDRIVFSARKYPGWEAKPDEPSRIVALNVVTGDYSDSGYRGRLFCLNHLGDMIIRTGGDDAIVYSSATTYQWLIGKWGSELSITQPPQDSFIPNYSCQFATSKNPIFSDNSQAVAFELQRDIPLLPEHGYLRENIKHINTEEIRTVQLITPDRVSKFVSDRAPQTLFFYFQPWTGEYFEKSALRQQPRIFHPHKGFSYIPIPRLFEYWSSSFASMAANVTPTKAGMLWDVHQGSGYWKKQGLYLEIPKNLLRIETGRGVYAVVSPDGCRIVDSVVRGDTSRANTNAYIWLVIDVCNLKR